MLLLSINGLITVFKYILKSYPSIYDQNQKVEYSLYVVHNWI